jgi:hypothetical protein
MLTQLIEQLRNEKCHPSALDSSPPPNDNEIVVEVKHVDSKPTYAPFFSDDNGASDQENHSLIDIDE